MNWSIFSKKNIIIFYTESKAVNLKTLMDMENSVVIEGWVDGGYKGIKW